MAKYGSEQILPYNNEEHKATQVKRMFDSIAGTYDTLNHTLSFGIDKIWRKKGIAFLRPFSPESILDIATGTGDLAFLIHERLKPESLLGIDLSEGMLAVARQKAQERGVSDNVSFAIEDCLSLSLPDNSYDAITVAYGVRNFENLAQGFAEMYRVLSPGGVLCVIELSTPEHFPMRQLYKFYTYAIIPLVGRIVSRDKQAYTYLPRSVAAVAQGEEMLDIFRSVGFRNCRLRRLTFGACTIYMGEK